MTLDQESGMELTDSVRSVSAEALLQELRSGVGLTILDVRERPRIHDTGTIADARIYPLSQLAARMAELENLRATRIVVVSQRARRARVAARELEVAGFAEVFILEGGMHRWLELGYPVEPRHESSRPSVRS